jgi:hypothetical protein
MSSTGIFLTNSNKLVISSDNSSLPYTYLQLEEDNLYSPMVFRSFSTNEIISIIKSLKMKNSFGYDEISPRILKLGANYIASPITYICNKVISTGTFPDRMKYSIVIPIFKKGNKSDPANYRPISMLASFAKVLETALYLRLTEHITINNLLTEHQYGFRKGHSTDEAIFKLTYEVLNALNDKSMVEAYFLIWKRLSILSTIHS